MFELKTNLSFHTNQMGYQILYGKFLSWEKTLAKYHTIGFHGEIFKCMKWAVL